MTDFYLGTIASFGFNFAPARDWALCDGSLVKITDNEALFSLIGTTFGGDGIRTFGLPDLRGRVPIGQGQGPGLANYEWGQKAGLENIQLSMDNIPPHGHDSTVSWQVNKDIASVTSPAGAYLATTLYGIYSKGDDGGRAAAPTASVSPFPGAGVPVPLMNPFQAISYCICVNGPYPTPN